MTNHEDVNKYYNQINNLVDEYLEINKIKPSNLRRYLQNGSERFKNFLKRNNLDMVKGSDRVLQDVIDDRYALEADSILTFEKFNIFESDEFKLLDIKECLYKGVSKSTLEHEKILADVFDTNLGLIDPVDGDKHIYSIEGFGKEKLKVIIYLSSEIDIINNNIQEYAWEVLSKSSVKVTDGISIQLGNLINREMFNKNVENNINKQSTINTIKSVLGMDLKGNSEKFAIFVETNTY